MKVQRSVSELPRHPSVAVDSSRRQHLSQTLTQLNGRVLLLSTPRMRHSRFLAWDAHSDVEHRGLTHAAVILQDRVHRMDVSAPPAKSDELRRTFTWEKHLLFWKKFSQAHHREMVNWRNYTRSPTPRHATFQTFQGLTASMYKKPAEEAARPRAQPDSRRLSKKTCLGPPSLTSRQP